MSLHITAFYLYCRIVKEHIFRRIQRELQNLRDDLHSNVTARPVTNGDLYRWQLMLLGPDSSPYEDGIFFLDVIFPSGYPHMPPVFKFLTRILLASVADNGIVDVNSVLGRAWLPTDSSDDIIYKILRSMKGGKHELCREYEERAREWTEKYAL